MLDESSTDISELLEKAINEKIENFEIKHIGGNANREGYLGDILFLTLRNKNTGKEWHLVVKQILKTNDNKILDFLSNCYFNETYFYTKVIPSYAEFQKSYPNCKIFDGVAKYLAASMEKGNEKIVLENLKAANYEAHPRLIPVTDEMYEEIFKFYGSFHGLSMAFKIHQPEKFFELARPLHNNFKTFAEDVFSRFFEYICSSLSKHFDKIGESEISKKIEKYVKNGLQLYVESLSYQSRFPVILHGDCWSNNMMFKYNDIKRIEDIKLLDFQMVICGSPVLDLSYSFYSSAEKETLDKLDHFLLLYHNSLRETLKQYDCDVDKIFSFEDLKKEWKENNKFGFLMGLMWCLAKTKDVSENTTVSDLIDRARNIEETKEEEEDKKKTIGDCNNETFLQMTTALIKHMYENDFL